MNTMIMNYIEQNRTEWDNIFLTNSELKTELRRVIGKSVSQNQSPTLMAKLVKINKTTCTFESVANTYTWSGKVGIRYSVPIQFAWNAYFF
jgi:hypothetical protein